MTPLMGKFQGVFWTWEHIRVIRDQEQVFAWSCDKVSYHSQAGDHGNWGRPTGYYRCGCDSTGNEILKASSVALRIENDFYCVCQ